MTYLHQIDPIAIQFPAFELFGRSFHPGIHWYGIMYLLAFLVAWWLGRRRILAGRLPGVDMNAFGDLMFYGMLGVVLGGRIGYVLFYAFGDFLRGYLIVDRTGVRVLRDPFTNKPYVHFYTTKRVGGGVQNFEAIKLLKIAAA